jgi:hypothetical protein
MRLNLTTCARVFLAVTTLACAATAQRIRLCNPANGPQTRWVTVAVPMPGPTPDPGSCAILGGLLAVRGPDLGSMAQTWQIRASLAAGETRTVDGWAPSCWADTPAAWPALPSTPEELAELLPVVSIADPATGTTVAAVLDRATLVGRTAASMRWRCEAHRGGWHAVVWETIWAWQDAIDVAGYVSWCDPGDGRWALPRRRVAVGWGAGWDPYGPLRWGMAPQTGGGRLVWDGPVPGGMAFCFRGIIHKKTAGDSEATRDLLSAAAESPILAVAEWPDGSWFGFGSRPDPGSRCNPNVFAAWWNTQGTLADYRPGASLLYAGSTGAQPCFGATKGLQAASGDPWALQPLLVAADDGLLRCGHYVERDGTPVTIATHPRWTTWSWATHVGSEDLLGKTRLPESARWQCIGERDGKVDDQHRGDQPEIAGYVLSGGDPMLAEDLQFRLAVDEARVKGRLGQLDAPRATGRLLQSWAKCAMVAPPGLRTRWRALAVDTLKTLEDNWPLRSADVKATQVMHDARVLPDGLPAWSPWQEGLLVLGLLEQARTWERLGDSTLSVRFLAAAQDLADTVVDFGLLRDADSRWQMGYGVELFGEGNAPPGWYYLVPREGAGYSPSRGTDLVLASSNWWPWLAGSIVATRDRVRRAALLADPSVVSQETIEEKEWWAVR